MDKQIGKHLFCLFITNLQFPPAFLYTPPPPLSPSQGVGGAVQLPKGFLKNAFQVVREKGGVCIADEVGDGQTTPSVHTS